MRKTVLKIDSDSQTPGSVCDLLSGKTGLSKSRIKDAMNKGAVWLKRTRGGLKRLRRATERLRAGDHIELYYNEEILSAVPPEAQCLEDRLTYSVWHKPAGLLSQGTKYGDHCSLLRQAELFFHPSRGTFLVHRLDREVPGIMLIAHTSRAAAELSSLFGKNEIEKKYRAEVLGIVGRSGVGGKIEFSLDGEPAVTEYRVISCDQEKNTSLVEILLRTGRLHQIRRHLDMIGHPVMGDPRYGKGNKNTEGMRLTAVSLKFFCPLRRREAEFVLPQ
jgi:tRNA pseudouridine32 synthase/23S rRNA pseudouridine746 synthase